ncbi:MAG: prealbumin-like fold domain-containing protein [Clostridium sp.]
MVDRWTSGNTPHRIMGRLNAGELYTLSEVTAPSGYQIAEEVTFTVSEDGTIDRVVMEDKRKEPEIPEEPEKPEKPERPVPDDDRETEPETPGETETPETEPTEETRKKGIITARYEIELDGRGELGSATHPGSGQRSPGRETSKTLGIWSPGCSGDPGRKHLSDPLEEGYI